MLNNDLTVSSVRHQTKRATTTKQETPALTYRKNLEADTVTFGSTRISKTLPFLYPILGLMAGYFLGNIDNKQPEMPIPQPDQTEYPIPMRTPDGMNGIPDNTIDDRIPSKKREQLEPPDQLNPSKKGPDLKEPPAPGQLQNNPDFNLPSDLPENHPPQSNDQQRPIPPSMPDQQPPQMKPPAPPQAPPPMMNNSPTLNDTFSQDFLGRYDVKGPIKSLLEQITQPLMLQEELLPSSVSNYISANPDTDPVRDTVQLDYDNGLSLLVLKSEENNIKVTSYFGENGPCISIASKKAFVASIDNVNPQTSYIIEVTEPSQKETLITTSNQQSYTIPAVTLLGYNIKIDDQIKIDSLTSIGTAHSANNVKVAYIDGARQNIYGRDREGVTFFVQLDDARAGSANFSKKNIVAPFAKSDKPYNDIYEGDHIFILPGSKRVNIPSSSLDLWDMTDGFNKPFNISGSPDDHQYYYGPKPDILIEWWLSNKDPEGSYFTNWLDEQGIPYDLATAN